MNLRIIYSFLLCMILLGFRSFGQEKKENFIISESEKKQSNWNIDQTDITIDTNFILKSEINFDGSIFNYKRVYKLNKRYREWSEWADNPLEVIEYGNVDKRNKPNGIWLYQLQDNWTPIKGKVKNGHKIGWWKYGCSYICRIMYNWNWSFTKTKVKKKRIGYD